MQVLCLWTFGLEEFGDNVPDYISSLDIQIILTLNHFCFLGKRVGFQTAQLFISEELEALVFPDVVKACEEAGKAKGEEVFPGEFGGNVGAEAGIKAGKEAAIAKVVEMVQVNLN